MKHGDLKHHERAFGQPRSFAELVRDEPCLRDLQQRAVKATMTKRSRRAAWQRMVVRVMVGTVIVLWLALLAFAVVMLPQ